MAKRQPLKHKAPARRRVAKPATNLEQENAALRRERDEALEQRAAIAEILNIISGSPGDLEPVFDAILEKATRICEASFGMMLLYEGGTFRHVALHNAPKAFAPERQRIVPRDESYVLYRIVDSKRVIHIADLRVEAPKSQLTRLTDARTLLIVPMLKDDALIGAIGIYRQVVQPFTNKQIELLTNFSAQAVIAIENTRLLNELRQRTDDLSNALEQQTATSEVLEVISNSTGDLQPVFEAMLKNAVRLCEASFGALLLYEGDEAYRVAALHNAPPAYVDVQRHRPVARAGPLTPHGRAGAAKQVLHVVDLIEDIAYKQRDRLTV
jgi:transcriptional regulator with GAF, ATPase, and Fis domain